MLASLWPYGSTADVRILNDAKVSALTSVSLSLSLVSYLSVGRVSTSDPLMITSKLMISFCRGTRWDVSLPRHHWNDELACQRKYMTIVSASVAFFLSLSRENE